MVCKRATRSCPCGYAGDPSGRCRCTPDAVRRYRARVSAPLLDRIDLQVDMPRVRLSELGAAAAPGEGSAAVRARVIAARARQLERAGKPNAALDNAEVQRDCALASADRALLERALD